MEGQEFWGTKKAGATCFMCSKPDIYTQREQDSVGSWGHKKSSGMFAYCRPLKCGTKEFLEWAKSQALDTYVNALGEYASTITRGAWLGWQAHENLNK